MDTNNVVIIGRLTRDLEIKNIGEYVICEFSVAINGLKKDDVSYIDCKAWNKTAEFLKEYCSKGKQICVQGNLKQDRWENKEGKIQSKIYINVTNVQLFGSFEKKNELVNNPNANDDIPF